MGRVTSSPGMRGIKIPNKYVTKSQGGWGPRVERKFQHWDKAAET